MKIQKIILQEREIDYTLIKKFRTRNIRIHVGVDGSLKVFAPSFVSENYLEKILLSKTDWIFKKIQAAGKIKKINLPEGLSMFQLKNQAREIIEYRISLVNQVYNFSFERIFIRDQKTRWGSCSTNRNLNFNYKIAFLPECLTDYVIAHELCHLAEMNHSYKFWELVTRAVPDYKIKRRELRKWRS